MATTKPVLIASAAILAAQDGIRTTIVKLDQSIHDNAVQCLLHAEKHGDTSLMRRLLVDILDVKTGYRRQGLINWMRKHSPMELSGKDINLKGVDQLGNKRPFLIAEANLTPFWLDNANAEQVARPVFQGNLISKIAAAVREFKALRDNTDAQGSPKDPTKPYLVTDNGSKLTSLIEGIEVQLAGVPEDFAERRFKAKLELAKLPEPALPKATKTARKAKAKQVLDAVVENQMRVEAAA